MRTMFSSQDINSKKKFQKPNILRKRSKKPVKPNAFEVYESPDPNSLVNNHSIIQVNEDIHLETLETRNSTSQSDLDSSIETELGRVNEDEGATVSPYDSKLTLNNNVNLVEDIEPKSKFIILST